MQQLIVWSLWIPPVESSNSRPSSCKPSWTYSSKSCPSECSVESNSMLGMSWAAFCSYESIFTASAQIPHSTVSRDSGDVALIKLLTHCLSSLSLSSGGNGLFESVSSWWFILISLVFSYIRLWSILYWVLNSGVLRNVSFLFLSCSLCSFLPSWVARNVLFLFLSC